MRNGFPLLISQISLMLFCGRINDPAEAIETASWKVFDDRPVDPDGNVYTTVRIGSQIWMVEDLRTTKYSDGSPIPRLRESVSSKEAVGYAWYGDNIDFLKDSTTFGALYTWYVIATGRLAPVGWRVPTDADWATLQNYLIMNEYNYDKTTTENKIGKALAAREYWDTGGTGNGEVGNDLTKNNASGFSALPSGGRDPDGHFFGYCGLWWSATEYSVTDAQHRYLCNDDSALRSCPLRKEYGCSVRLVTDAIRSGPVAPRRTNVVAGNGTVTVTWDTVLWATSYRLYCQLGTTVDRETGEMTSGVISPWRIRELTNGMQYAFAVSAVDSTGESNLSETATAMPTETGGGLWIVTDSSLVDPDGNTYSTIVIGAQVWITQNLKTTKFNDGKAIPLVTGTVPWRELTTPGMCWYNNTNNDRNKQKWGALYNWYAVNTGRLAPSGWHVPTKLDWETLSDSLGGAAFAGGKMKVPGTTYCTALNVGATDASNFSALPAGWRNMGWFACQGTNGFWWSATEIGLSTAYGHGICCEFEFVTTGDYSDQMGLSVRLIRDS